MNRAAIWRRMSKFPSKQVIIAFVLVVMDFNITIVEIILRTREDLPATCDKRRVFGTRRMNSQLIVLDQNRSCFLGDSFRQKKRKEKAASPIIENCLQAAESEETGHWKWFLVQAILPPRLIVKRLHHHHHHQSFISSF